MVRKMKYGTDAGQRFEKLVTEHCRTDRQTDATDTLPSRSVIINVLCR